MPGTPARDSRPGFKSLRTARVLAAGMVITVEPGCYFNPVLLLPALQVRVRSCMHWPGAASRAHCEPHMRLQGCSLLSPP